MDFIKNKIKELGMPRFIIILFILILTVISFFYGHNIGKLTSDVIVRFGMNFLFALAMVPTVMSGSGLNFGLPVGVLCGIMGGLIAIELNITGLTGIIVAGIIATPISLIAGYFYGKLINAVKGSEMVVGTYVGYSVVSIMCIAWLLLPFKSPAMIWPLGGVGLRNTIVLDGFFTKAINDFLAFKPLNDVIIPTGLILVVVISSILMWLFMISKTGIQLKAVGDNPKFAVASGISVDKARMIGTILSTFIGAMGIIVFAQSMGFFQLYTSPLNVAFAPIAAVLLGGASTKKIKLSHVLIGTMLFQVLITIALPVANEIFPGGMAEIMRIIISNGIILYALTQSGGKEK